MTETAAAVAICSNALMLLGAKPIASFNEASAAGSNLDRAKLCASLYPMVRKALLRGHYWNSAARRVLLSPDVTPPTFGYSYRFQLPGDWLRTWAVGDENGRQRIAYRTEGRHLLSNEVSLPLLYAADIDETDWDSLMVEVMTAAMAYRLAYPVTASTSVEELKLGELRELLRQARAIDGQDDPPETFGDSPLLQSRLGGGLLG